jgi:hypothetical protein
MTAGFPEQSGIILRRSDSAYKPISYKQKIATSKSLGLENESLCGIKNAIGIAGDVRKARKLVKKANVGKRDRRVSCKAISVQS